MTLRNDKNPAISRYMYAHENKTETQKCHVCQYFKIIAKLEQYLRCKRRPTRSRTNRTRAIDPTTVSARTVPAIVIFNYFRNCQTLFIYCVYFECHYWYDFGTLFLSQCIHTWPKVGVFTKSNNEICMSVKF